MSIRGSLRGLGLWNRSLTLLVESILWLSILNQFNISLSSIFLTTSPLNSIINSQSNHRNMPTATNSLLRSIRNVTLLLKRIETLFCRWRGGANGWNCCRLVAAGTPRWPTADASPATACREQRPLLPCRKPRICWTRNTVIVCSKLMMTCDQIQYFGIVTWM